MANDLELPYDPHNWYWTVAGDAQNVFSSARSTSVPITDVTYVAWCSNGGIATIIDTQDNLVLVLRAANVPPYHLVAKRVIVDRLQTANLLTAARAALNAADLYTQERWNTRDSIYADDPDARALLTAIGADPNVILAQ